MIKFTCTKDIFRIIYKKKISDTKNTLRTHDFIQEEKLGIIISGLLYIVIDETDM